MNCRNSIGKAVLLLGESGKRNPALLLFLAVALAVRVFVYFHTAIINPDGPLYIFQARALFLMDHAALTKCGLSYVSIYPFLIYLAHLFIGDWDTAAQMVSLFFGTALLLPTYLLLREFFSKPVSQCTTLAVGLVPIMVCSSVDVVRDPVAWFFLVTGLWLVILSLRRGRRLLLLLALLSFVLATWARIESLVYILATAVTLPIVSGRERWRNSALFCGPIVAVAFLVLVLGLTTGGLCRLFRFNEVLGWTEFFARYGELRQEVMGILATHSTFAQGEAFILEAKRFAWLIAGAGVLNRFVEAFSYGFSMLFFVGLWRFRRRFTGEVVPLYFLIACGFSLLLLYAFMVQNWIMEYRYAVSVIIGGLVIFGVGVEWLLDWLGRYLKPVAALTVAAGLLFLSVAPKIFQERAASELVFKDIGLAAAALAPGQEPAMIMASDEHIRLLTHYANSRRAVPVCPQLSYSTYGSLPGGGPVELLAYLRTNHIGFLLWEENNWPQNTGVFSEGAIPDNFSVIGRWSNPQAGRLTFFRVS